MYPFERFTETSKRVFTLAQAEAERAHQSYIGTEHIVLAFLRVPESVAGVVLERINVDSARVRQIIEITLNASERIVVQQIIPTSRVKKIIEISFDEARRMGDHYVGTEHLLLGMLIEGEGVAAHVLNELGANLERVAAEIETVRKDGSIAEAVGPRGAVARYSATQPSSGLRLVAFDRVEAGVGGSEALYVNPLEVVRVDPVDADTSSVTLRHGAGSSVVVRGSVHEVARRLTQA